MDKKNRLEKYEEVSKNNNTNNSILNMYANVKQMNNFKSLIADNNEEILKEISKYDEKISVIQDGLDTLKIDISQIQSFNDESIKNLEIKLNSNNINILEEIDKSIQPLIKKIEENKESIKKGKIDFNCALTEQIKEAENKNIDLVYKKIEEFKNSINVEENIDKAIVKIETQTLDKIQKLEKGLLYKLEEKSNKTENLIVESISKLNIGEITDNISTLEKLNSEQVKKIKDTKISLEEFINSKTNELSNSFEIQLEDVKSQNQELKNVLDNEKEYTNTLITTNVENIKSEISELEKDALNRLQELEKNLSNNIEEEKHQREKLISESISSLNIENIKNNISNLEIINTEKVKKLENNIAKLEELISIKSNELSTAFDDKIENVKSQNQEFKNDITKKLEEVNYLNLIQSLECSILEQKERIKIVEELNNSISEKIKGLDETNQKRLDNFKKEQEKFVIEKNSELATIQETNAIKSDLEKLTKKAQDIEKLTEQVQKNMYSDIQNYIEKRILKMKYAATIQQITDKINNLNKKIDLLQSSQDSENETNQNIEEIINKKLAEQERYFMQNIENIVKQQAQKTIREIIEKQKAKKGKSSIVKRETETITSSHSIIKNNVKQRNKKTSLDDMVSTLQKYPINKSINTISTLNKNIKKSQILNFDN